ncbi:MAG: ATP-binding cassette domain-containing protein [Candidatus Atribacteria bacterium]|nr:ATP-binding cassette domain-containing protein [Candidatus Atribacteria bacterium]
MGQSRIIEMKHVSTIYEGEKVPSLFDITLSIAQGEFVCIVGPNGAGKTTLLETLNGLIPHTDGQVHILGKNIKEKGVFLRKQIGYLPQEFTVDPLSPFLVKDIILMGRYGKIGLFKNISKNDYWLLERSLKIIGIEELKDKPIGKLSGGQLQKVMLARVLTKRPSILFLDEPFSNLDYRSTHTIAHQLSCAHDENHWTTLMVIHDLASLPKHCNRVIYLEEGRVVKDDTPEKVLTEDLLETSLPSR